MSRQRAAARSVGVVARAATDLRARWVSEGISTPCACRPVAFGPVLALSTVEERSVLVSDALFVSVEEAARRIGIGRTLAYELCRTYLEGRAGGLRCVRLGRRLLIPVWVMDELGRDREAAQDTAR